MLRGSYLVLVQDVVVFEPAAVAEFELVVGSELVVGFEPVVAAAVIFVAVVAIAAVDVAAEILALVDQSEGEMPVGLATGTVGLVGFFVEKSDPVVVDGVVAVVGSCKLGMAGWFAFAVVDAFELQVVFAVQ